MREAVYEVEIMHARAKPVRQRFKIRGYTFFTDVARLDAGGELPGLFHSYRRGDFSLLAQQGVSAVESALSFLQRKSGIRADQVGLLANPRILGYVFNPVSFFFYYKTSGVFLILLIFTIISDYNWGRLIYQSKSESRKKVYLTISLLFNLTLLCYFKYAYFFTESVNQLAGTDISFFNHFTQFSKTFLGTTDPVDKLILPVGISFFTFQSISYTIDMYRGKVTPVKSIFDYGFFVCFFPHLVAGPIVKANEFLYQI